MCLMFPWGYYICAADICNGFTSFIYFGKVACFFSDAWIGSNDLMIGSVWDTDAMYETRAWQQ